MKRFFLKGCRNGGSQRRIREERAQALSELAILGALILLGFGAVLSYTQMMNSRQSLEMRAFRRALALSCEHNKVVSYTIVRNAPVINVGDIFGRPDTSRVSASAMVNAIRKDPLFVNPEDRDKRPSREYYEIDGRVYEVAPIKVKVVYEDDDYETWMPAPIHDVQYFSQKQRSGRRDKTENASSISTTHFGSVSVSGNTKLIIENRDIFEQDYLQDLRDNVGQDPWEKRFQMERSSLDLAKYLEFGLATTLHGILSHRWGGLRGCRGGATELKNAWKAVATLFVSGVLGHFLNQSEAANPALDVVVVEGWRPSDSLSGTASFDIGSTFNVPH